MTAPPLTPSQALRRPRARKRAGGADHLDPGTRLLLLQLEEQLAKLFGPRLRGLILFGSRARGDHGEDSDADVAVILAGPVENRFSLKSAIIDETYELFLESGILIQPWPIEEGWLDDPEEAPAPHIVRAILREGIAMIGRADALMAKSQEALESARADLEAGRLSGASSRAYYAMFHAARAALEAHGIETNGRRHGTIIRRFSLTCVKAGLLDPVHGRNLNKALEIRREGDYDLETPDQESVATAVRNASAFVEAITALIEQVGQP